MEVYGLFGEKLSHSMSPHLFKILFEKYKIIGAYSLFEISRNNFKNSVDAVKILNIKGVNVTIPYKEEVITQLDEIDDSVKKINACNTIKIENGKALGYNTDYYGVLNTLRYNNVNPEGKDCVILGSGGASKSVISLLKDLKVNSIKIVQREKKGLDDNLISYLNYAELEKIESSYLLVNTTPVGMYPNVNESPIPCEIMKKFEVCFDAVYNPLETKFLKIAKELNLQTIDGLYMLVGQGIKSFEIFTGLKVDREDFFEIYEEVSKLLKEKI